MLVIADDFIANVDAFIADVDCGTRNEFLDFVLRLATERTTERVVTSSYHSPGNSILFRLSGLLQSRGQDERAKVALLVVADLNDEHILLEPEGAGSRRRHSRC